MPRIQAPPRIVNTGQVAQAGMPRLGPEYFGAQAGQGIGRLGYTLGEIDQDLRNQQDELDAIQLGGEYEGKVLEMKDALRENPRWEEHEKSFTKGITDLQAEYLKNAPTNGTKMRLSTMFARSTAQEVNKVRIEARKFAIENEKETFRQIQTDYAGRSLDNPDLDGLHERLLTNMTARRVLTPKEAGDMRIEYRTKKADAHMRKDPAEFLAAQNDGKYNDLDITTRLKMGEQAQLRIESQERKAESDHKKLSERVYQDAYSKALNKALPSSWLQEAIDNKNPYVKPSEAKTLFELQNKPGTGAEDKTVAALQLQYRSGPTSAARVAQFRAQAQQLMSSMTEPNETLSKFFDELMSDERTERGFGITLQAADRSARGEGRAVRAEDRTEQNHRDAQIKKQVDAALVEYDANKTSLPFNNPIFQKKEQQTKAKIENDIRKGRPAEEVLKEALGKAKASLDKIPERRKSLIDAANGRK
jgi:hypothetical protein